MKDKIVRESLSENQAFVNGGDVALRRSLRKGHSLLVNTLILAHNFTNKRRQDRVKLAIVVNNLRGNLRDKLVVECDNKFVFCFCSVEAKSDIDVLA